MIGGNAYDEFELVLRRVAFGARLLGLAWWAVLSVLVILESDDLAHPWIPAATAVAASLWALVTIVAFGRSPMTMTAAPMVVGDLLLASGAIVASTVAYAEAVARSAAPTVPFHGGFPFIVVVVASIRGVKSGWAVAVVLATVTLTVRGIGEGSLASPVSQVLVYLAGAFIATWTVRVFRRSDAEIRLANEALARAEERAEISQHLHDSVLQSLALIQRASERPDEVVGLARRQERELRDYLFGMDVSEVSGLGEAVRVAAAEVEEDYRVPIDVVVVGDAGGGLGVDAIVSAAKEAMVNGAKHASSPHISVYVEVDVGVARVFVRDRGLGFDPDAVAADRRGITGSIRDRVERVGGTAFLRTAPGRGTEWTLEVPI